VLLILDINEQDTRGLDPGPRVLKARTFLFSKHEAPRVKDDNSLIRVYLSPSQAR
jgi:hypothetical protein